MDLEARLIPYLSTIIVVATAATVVLAVFSYVAFKFRDRRRPKAAAVPVFFRRYVPPEAAAAPAEPLESPPEGAV